MNSHVLIEDFCKTSSGGTPSRSKSEFYKGGTIPWVKSGELNRGVVAYADEHITDAGLTNSSAKLVPPGTILLAMYGATVGKVAKLETQAATNQAICSIQPDTARCDTNYLIHCLRSKYNEFISKSVGGGQPNISQQIIRKTKIPLPH
jgi:type I restriction enzyme S subunit